MAHQTEVVLLLILAIAAAAFADAEKPLSEDDFDRLVQVARNRSERGGCPLGWVKYDGRCYSYHGVSMDWASAENHCLNFNANLLSVRNDYEHWMAKSLIRSYDPTEKTTWLGLSNCQKMYNWYWSDGTRYSFNVWNLGEPNHHYYGECCAVMNLGVRKNWGDTQCTDLHPFLCVRRIN